MVRLVCLNGMIVTDKGKLVSIQRRVHLGRETYPGLPPAELQREIDDLVSQALRLSWAGAGGMTRDIKRQVETLVNTPVPLETRDAVHRAVSELALQTAMRFAPGVAVDQIVETYDEEVEEERKRMAEAPGVREAVVAGTAWGLYNAFTRYATHTAGARRLSTARSLHHLGRKFPRGSEAVPAKTCRAHWRADPGRPPRPSPANEDGPGRALVTGSLAYDFILDYHGDFQPKLDIREGVRHTSVFEVGNLRRAMGGCAGNIAYTMAQLGSDPVLIGAVGEDGGPYIEHLRRCGINAGEVRQLDSVLTAQAFVVNDRGQNQLIFFFPGAMERTHEVALEPHLYSVRMAILAPSSRKSTLAHAAVLAREGVPIMLDLGQGL